MAAVASVPPRYIVTLSDSVCARATDFEARRLIGFAESLMKCLYEMPELQAFVDRDYEAETNIGPLKFYRRRDSAVSPAAAADTPRRTTRSSNAPPAMPAHAAAHSHHAAIATPANAGAIASPTVSAMAVLPATNHLMRGVPPDVPQ